MTPKAAVTPASAQKLHPDAKMSLVLETIANEADDRMNKIEDWKNAKADQSFEERVRNRERLENEKRVQWRKE